MTEAVDPVHGPEYVFIVGCPRSGTTWLQLLLSRHPCVVTVPETQIFAFYLARLKKQWDYEHGADRVAAMGQAGLSRVLSQERFDGLCRKMAKSVLDTIAAQKPQATHLVEKSPSNALHASWIQRLFPKARFLHMIRDPRDTVASLLAANRTWGSDWTPNNPINAARKWCRHVRGAQRIGRDTPAVYREVRYEALSAAPARELEGVASWLGLSWDRRECEAVVEQHEFSKLKKEKDHEQLPIPAERSPAEFFRRGQVGGWADDLPRGHVKIVETVCAELMDELGYDPVTRGSHPARVVVHDGLQRFREYVDWGLHKVLGRV